MVNSGDWKGDIRVTFTDSIVTGEVTRVTSVVAMVIAAAARSGDFDS